MAKIPTNEELRRLATYQEPNCVTIYLPYIEANAATSPMQIALKDKLKEAAVMLEAAGLDEKSIRRTLRAGRDLAIEKDGFWPHRRESLALFMHEKLTDVYRVPAEDMPSRVRIGPAFDVRPLARVISASRYFAVLVLDRHATQLYVGDQFHLVAAPLKDFPADMENTLNIDEFPSSRELHGIGPAYIGKGSEGYHGQYNVREVNKLQLTEFFRIIDRRLHRYLFDRHLPLIIAGVGYLLPLYRAVNTYKGLAASELHGSFRRARLDQIHDRAWAILRRQAQASINKSHAVDRARTP